MSTGQQGTSSCDLIALDLTLYTGYGDHETLDSDENYSPPEPVVGKQIDPNRSSEVVKPCLPGDPMVNEVTANVFSHLLEHHGHVRRDIASPAKRTCSGGSGARLQPRSKALPPRLGGAHREDSSPLVLL